MKLAVIALIACFYVASVQSAAVSTKLRQWPPKMDKALEKCSSEHHIEKDVAQEILSHIRQAKTEEDKCLMSCYMTDMGYLVDHKINWESLLESHTARVSDQHVKDKMKQVFKSCEENFVYDGKNDCQIAYDAYNCN